MTRFFTADLHLGHANIIRYCDRPFADVDSMDAALAERWNDVVAADDEVWVLGDLAMGRLEQSLQWVQRLNGRKVLVPGNHDRCWSGRPDAAAVATWTARYLDAGFDEIRQGSCTVSVGGMEVLCCHFPYRGDSHDEPRFAELRPVDDGQVLLHGHVHNAWRVDDNQINVGTDVWDYTPVSEATLAPLVRAAAQSAEVVRI